MHEGSRLRGIMRKTVVTLGLALVFLAVLGMDVRADVTFTNPGPDLQTFLNAAGLTQGDLNNKIDSFFNSSGFLKNFGDAQSFTSKGMGVDYASEATYFEVGGSVNFALGMDRTYQPDNSQNFPIQGVGFNASVMAGLSLGFLGIPVMLFANGMHVPTLTYGAMSGTLDNFGAHVQLRLFGPSRDTSALKMLVRWGGIAITTGFDYSHMNLGLTQKDFKSSFSIPESAANGVNVDVAGLGSGTLSIDMKTMSIPIELTTSVRLLTLLTVYGGLGFDLQLGGGSTLDLNVSAAMTGHVQGLPDANLGTATVTASAHADPSPAKIRGLMGLQFNLWLIRPFLQFNVANTSPTMASLAAGLRVAY